MSARSSGTSRWRSGAAWTAILSYAAVQACVPACFLRPPCAWKLCGSGTRWLDCGLRPLGAAAALGTVTGLVTLTSAPFVQVIPEAEDGTPDLAALDAALAHTARACLRLGCFSGTSNVTGIAPDVRRLSRILHRHGAYAAFDFSAAVSHARGVAEGSGSHAGVDAVMLPPNKFAGGPGSCGVLLVRKDIVRDAQSVAGARGPPSSPRLAMRSARAAAISR